MRTRRTAAATRASSRCSATRSTDTAPLPVTLDDARASLELVTAIYAADACGASVSLPLGANAAGYADWSAGRRGATGSA